MADQLLQNNGFEDELQSYITQGSVSTNSDIVYSGKKSALLLATPMAIAELSQVVFFISPGSPVNFSFFARKFFSDDVKSVSNFRIEVNFVNALGRVIPSAIVIKGSSRDISENEWKRYNGHAVAPPGTIAAQVVIRLEPPESGTSGLLVDDLELVSEVAMPAQPPTPAHPVQPGIPSSPGFPFTPPPVPVPSAQPGTPAFPGFPFTPPQLPLQPTPAFPVQQNPAVSGLPLVNPMFPGLPFASPGIPGAPFANPAVPGSPFANPIFPGSPFVNPVVPGSPFVNPPFGGTPLNMVPETPGAAKKEDQGLNPSKSGNTPDPGKKEK